MFGTGEYALRALPLIAGISSLFLFWAISVRVFRGWAVPYAVGLFSLAIPFVYFSSQVKQYSSDVAVSLLLLLTALHLHRERLSRPKLMALAVVGACLAWFSQTALFVITGAAASFAVLRVRELRRASINGPLIVVFVWVVSAIAAAAHATSVVSETDRHYFTWFWGDGFMPFKDLRDALWLPRKLVWVFGAFAPGLGHTNGGLNYRWSPIFAAVMLYGFWILWRTQRDTALLLGFPVLASIASSALGLYPFTARLLAFLIPFLLIAVAAGANQLVLHPPLRLPVLRSVAMAILGGAPLYAIAKALPPSRIQEFRPVMAYVAERVQKNDRIYVYSGAGLAFSYYAPRFKIPTTGAILGRCSLKDPRGYLRELDQLRGTSRVWLLVTHQQRAGELDLILGYLGAVGVQIDQITVASSNGHPIEAAHAHLYDLTSASRTQPTLAETFPLPASLTPLPESAARWGCYGITGGEPSR